MPSGTFAGTAAFAPREPTAPGYAAEYLYAEEGVLRTDNGLEFPRGGGTCGGIEDSKKPTGKGPRRVGRGRKARASRCGS